MTTNVTTFSKVPELTLGFWCIKILATTLGETAGDALSMSLELGYLVSTGILFALFAAAVAGQVAVKRFHPAVYWIAIIASTMVGTTLADFADRSLGIGYLGGSLLLLALVLGTLLVWYRWLGTCSVGSIDNPRAEYMYWLTIMFSQTLGTALGDWTADSADLGYLGAAAIFGGLLAVILVLAWKTTVSRVALFWAAFILTRPLGAVVGDFLDKPHDHGGLALSRFTATAILLVLIVAGILFFPQRAAKKAH